MYLVMRVFFHYLRRLIIYFNKIWMLAIPKDSRLVLFSSWFGKKYADSCKYEYEFLLNDSRYKAVWYTNDRDIYIQLQKENKPVVYGPSLKGIWYQIRAKVLVSSVQFDDFNPMFYQGAILLDLDHGFPVKHVAFARNDNPRTWKGVQKLMRLGMDYRMTASSSFCCEKICYCYNINPSQVVYVNKPRIDVLFDETLQINKKQVEEIKQGRKAIIWMPTHRSSGKILMDVDTILGLDCIQEVCERNNLVFIIRKHFYHKTEVVDTSKYANIFDLTSSQIDSQVLLSQADVLISDYSASYIDFLALDRPILLYCYDLDEYLKNERGLFVKIEENTAGQMIRSKSELYEAINRIANDLYDSQYAEGRKMARLKYFDESIEFGSSRQRVREIIGELIEGKYEHQW